MNLTDTLNADYIDAQYALWKRDPEAVSREWQAFFAGFQFAGDGWQAPGDAQELQMQQAQVEALKYRYRDIGHLLAGVDPLAEGPSEHPLLQLSAFGLTEEDLDREFYTYRFADTHRAPLRQILDILQETYCQSIGVEFMHLQDPQERLWLQDRMEPIRNRPPLDHDAQIRILNKLYQASLFEHYLNKKYAGQTRFSLEGAEAVIAMLDALLLTATEYGCTELILGMAHRGRLNVETNVLYKTYEEVFREFVNDYNPESLVGMGDVKYHNGYFTTIRLANKCHLRAFLVDNPSHLESVNPVVEGIARARQDLLPDGNRNQVLPLLFHGDAAFAGQGIVTETLNMSQLDGYKTEGTIHLVINNQIGFTTLPEHARSTRYSTDIAKMLMVPIFHVHGEDPEAAVHVAKLASSYRMEFGKDVVIDLICYRRYGHNEGDEPYFTQPQMYERIRERPSIHTLYAQKLLQAGIVQQEQLDRIEQGINLCLEEGFEAAQKNPRILPKVQFYENWEGFHGTYSSEPFETGVDQDTLLDLARKLNTIPDDLTPHSKLKRLLTKRLEAVETGEGIDWANAEALAFASLVTQGEPIRLSGEDSGRGTFSQRHCVMFDRTTGQAHVPLNHLSPDQAEFKVY
ncbi:2-oxoglutarate dehydrogenase E1 component, partial [candidate division KSB3 bacterium]|nr:2-oxoglutarate dehydrogenase E1 component [candidate division KSB3 bacterium]MBD3324466.1 2-oxoglutarate dehydrogenase E1 component [candidate division KSB3 bacterium]